MSIKRIIAIVALIALIIFGRYLYDQRQKKARIKSTMESAFSESQKPERKDPRLNKYDYISSISPGILEVTKDKKHGLYDSAGAREITPLEYDFMYSLREGSIVVEKNHKHSFINLKGELLLPFKYDFVLSFAEGMAMVRLNGMHGYVDQTGTEVIPLKYENASDFNEGLAMVKMGGKNGFIDKKGKLIIPCKFGDRYTFFKDGQCFITLNKSIVLINKTGAVIRKAVLADTIASYILTLDKEKI